VPAHVCRRDQGYEPVKTTDCCHSTAVGYPQGGKIIPTLVAGASAISRLPVSTAVVTHPVGVDAAEQASTATGWRSRPTVRYFEVPGRKVGDRVVLGSLEKKNIVTRELSDLSRALEVSGVAVFYERVAELRLVVSTLVNRWSEEDGTAQVSKQQRPTHPPAEDEWSDDDTSYQPTSADMSADDNDEDCSVSRDDACPSEFVESWLMWLVWLKFLTFFPPSCGCGSCGCCCRPRQLECR
jgi:hypothetical protein